MNSNLFKTIFILGVVFVFTTPIGGTLLFSDSSGIGLAFADDKGKKGKKDKDPLKGNKRLREAVRALQTDVANIELTPGPQGEQGVPGPTSEPGPQGEQGIQGETGTDGADGADGATGATGPQGETGAIGSQGEQGAQGIQGVAGATGADGATGPQGEQGETGESGQDTADGVYINKASITSRTDTTFTVTLLGPSLAPAGATPVVAMGINSSLNVNVVAVNQVTAEFNNVGTDGGTFLISLSNSQGTAEVDFTVAEQGQTGITGYEVVTTSSVVPAGLAAEIHASCPDGKSPMGGGFYDSSRSLTVNGSGPLNNDWSALFTNATVTDTTPSVYAICADVYTSLLHSGGNWEQATSDAGWSARQNHQSLIHDGKMWVLGGTDGPNNTGVKNDVWSSTDGITWTQVTASAACRSILSSSPIIWRQNVGYRRS